MDRSLFTPHGYCLAWDPTLIWLQATSDLLIALAYYSIPAVLVVMARRRRDLVFRPVFYLFAAFIMACGTTHLLGVISLWIPIYWTDAIVLAVTAALSLTTATLLWPLLPRFLALPSPKQLQNLNTQLAAQIAERDAAAAELRASEERLRYAQKMAAIGQLTGGIAHDFNNMLQGISSGVELMRRRIMQGRHGEALDFVEPTRHNIDRARTLVHGLMAFARRQPLAPKYVRLDKLVPSIGALLQQTIGPAIELAVDVRADSAAVHCDPSQLENALINLAINARDAMPQAGGKVTIEVENVTLTEADVAPWEGVRPGAFVRLTLSDTGSGMAPEVLERAVEPYFTTKPDGLGSGLGLSQVFGFVTQSNGILQLQSEIGRGSAIHLLLPAADEAAEPQATIVAPAAESVLAASVLLVDDEASIRRFVSMALRDAGCNVTEAPDAAAALALIRERASAPGARIDVLVTDVGLPGGLNGRQLADAAREILPGLPVVFITGYAGESMSIPVSLADEMTILTKPFELQTLIDAVLHMTRRQTAQAG